MIIKIDLKHVRGAKLTRVHRSLMWFGVITYIPPRHFQIVLHPDAPLSHVTAILDIEKMNYAIHKR